MIEIIYSGGGGNKANAMQAKFEKRMSARNDLVAMKKQVLDTSLTEEDKKCIMVYYRHKIISLIKTAEEKLKKHNAHPKLKKKATKTVKPDPKEVTEVYNQNFVLFSNRYHRAS